MKIKDLEKYEEKTVRVFGTNNGTEFVFGIVVTFFSFVGLVYAPKITFIDGLINIIFFLLLAFGLIVFYYFSHEETYLVKYESD